MTHFPYAEPSDPAVARAPGDRPIWLAVCNDGQCRRGSSAPTVLGIYGSRPDALARCAAHKRSTR